MLPPDFIDPPREFSLCPFWFWNDALSEVEIVRQIDDFQAHGVHAFVIHPRVGLPREIGWMSDAMLHFVRFAVEEAARRGMWVVLYDEGMYPSGSSSGQVVAEDPRLRCRALTKRLQGLTGTEDEELLLIQDGWEIVDRPIDSVIRGLHYVGEGPAEDEPPAADLLNPDAVACFIRCVYDRYAAVVGDHFGTTVQGIFTDEPSLLGRPRERGLVPGTRGILDHVLRLTGVDIRPGLGELWDEESEARRIYDRGIRLRLEETYYEPLSDWCRRHGLALMGHPERPDDLSALRYFDVPGQDLVWRWVLPGPTAIEGPQSTQAKAAASAALHAGKRRNSNELAGAYGHELTFEVYKWLIDWCAVRGTNLFFPHAFYYSVRGPRRDERPPDVGPHSPWWDRYPDFARYCARLCWLNTDSEHVCDVAILENDGELPWRAAKVLFENQIDFVYLARADLPEWSSRYRLLIAEGSPEAGCLSFTESPEFLPQVLSRVPRSLDIGAQADVRVRRVCKDGLEFCLVHNEGASAIEVSIDGSWNRFEGNPIERVLNLTPFDLAILYRNR